MQQSDEPVMRQSRPRSNAVTTSSAPLRHRNAEAARAIVVEEFGRSVGGNGQISIKDEFNLHRRIAVRVVVDPSLLGWADHHGLFQFFVAVDKVASTGFKRRVETRARDKCHMQASTADVHLAVLDPAQGCWVDLAGRSADEVTTLRYADFCLYVRLYPGKTASLWRADGLRAYAVLPMAVFVVGFVVMAICLAIGYGSTLPDAPDTPCATVAGGTCEGFFAVCAWEVSSPAVAMCPLTRRCCVNDRPNLTDVCGLGFDVVPRVDLVGQAEDGWCCPRIANAVLPNTGIVVAQAVVGAVLSLLFNFMSSLRCVQDVVARLKDRWKQAKRRAAEVSGLPASAEDDGAVELSEVLLPSELMGASSAPHEHLQTCDDDAADATLSLVPNASLVGTYAVDDGERMESHFFRYDDGDAGVDDDASIADSDLGDWGGDGVESLTSSEDHVVVDGGDADGDGGGAIHEEDDGDHSRASPADDGDDELPCDDFDLPEGAPRGMLERRGTTVIVEDDVADRPGGGTAQHSVPTTAADTEGVVCSTNDDATTAAGTEHRPTQSRAATSDPIRQAVSGDEMKKRPSGDREQERKRPLVARCFEASWLMCAKGVAISVVSLPLAVWSTLEAMQDDDRITGWQAYSIFATECAVGGVFKGAADVFTVIALIPLEHREQIRFAAWYTLAGPLMPLVLVAYGCRYGLKKLKSVGKEKSSDQQPPQWVVTLFAPLYVGTALAFAVLTAAPFFTHVLPGTVLFFPLWIMALSPVVIASTILLPLLVSGFELVIGRLRGRTSKARRWTFHVTTFTFFAVAVVSGNVFSMYIWSLSAGMMSLVYGHPGHYLGGDGSNYPRALLHELAARSASCYELHAMQSFEIAWSSLMQFL